MAENRMDRIEKSMEEFFRGMAELRESQKKTDRQVAETSKKLGELGITEGRVAEDLFYRNVRYAFGQKDIDFSDVRRNVRKKGISGEYDIVAVGENRILVVEVKKRWKSIWLTIFWTGNFRDSGRYSPNTAIFRSSAGSARW